MKLYKYVTADRIDVIQNRMIRFTPPFALNDPFEMQPIIGGLADDDFLEREFEENYETTIRRLYESEPIFSLVMPFDAFRLLAMQRKHVTLNGVKAMAKHVTPILNERVQELNQHIGVLSLTTEPENLLMWAHYAGNHQGMVIEFDGLSHFFNRKRSENDECYHLREVNYSKERPRRNFIDIDVSILLLTKSVEWGYEKELRVMAPLCDADKVIKGAECDIHLFSFDPKCVSSIIFGARTATSVVGSITEWVRGSQDYTHVRIKKSVLDRDRFAVQIME
ncbi:hypothetical protein TSH58p_04450 [Azospirillum sp. TSH58]|uniref:DUF2971 domain-containing protein n=1 Tax=Azospirillum sp. TSH58 TaxID=664962 RepID=UPI000D6011B7|nr:DUF2971 domain-containing protein [Azospirillum sp. TSH58]AWJ82833.1 hypothetical protein TSH58p_04450 [Azospirillum sp. TSH58]